MSDSTEILKIFSNHQTIIGELVQQVKFLQEKIGNVDELCALNFENIKQTKIVADRALHYYNHEERELFKLRKSHEKLFELINYSSIKHAGSDNDILIPLGAINLSTRAYNALKNADIHYVNQLVKMTKNELRKIKNLGNHTLEEIISTLRENGLELMHRSSVEQI